MLTTNQLKKNAQLIDQTTTKCILELLNYFCKKLQHGYFLNSLDLTKYKFYYSPAMTEQTGIMGMWSFTDKYGIYLVKYNSDYVYKDQFQQNFSKIDSILNIFSTVLHQIYHSWQYQSAPILYLINFVTFVFFYKYAQNWNFTIEGDVRKYIDNEQTEKIISQFSSHLSAYKFNMSIYEKLKSQDDEEAIKTYKENLKYYYNEWLNYNELQKKTIKNIIKILGKQDWIENYGK